MIWIPSPNFNLANRKPGDVRVIVIHTMEAPKTSDAAISGATNWFALPSSGVSAHFLVDSDHVVQAVLEKDIAWHARGDNTYTIGIEHAGSAAQSPTQWNDDYNRKMLARSASLTADVARTWNIPIVWLTADQVKAGASGITGHREITDAFLDGQGHGDPGPNFPRNGYIALVKKAKLLAQAKSWWPIGIVSAVVAGIAYVLATGKR